MGARQAWWGLDVWSMPSSHGIISPVMWFRRSLPIWLLISAVLSGCAFDPSQPTAENMTAVEIGTETPTPFQPLPATTVPEEVSIWLSPALPSALRQAAIEGIEEDPSLIIVNSESEAEVQIESFADQPLSEWIYAMVAPFPTVADGSSWGEFQLKWLGRSTGPIWVSSSTASALEPLMGAPPSSSVEIIDEKLVEHAWDAGEGWAVIPFEELEPRWKVMQVEGESPIRMDFTPDQYRLVVPFGLSGDPAAISRVRPFIDFPQLNRDPSKLTVVVMTGVTALTRATAWRMEQKGITYPGQLIGDWLRNADITHVSNEVSFWEACPPPQPIQPNLRFCSDPDYIDLLLDLEVDIVELTGNHNLDFGPEPYLYSLDLYEGVGIQPFAGGTNLADAIQPLIIEHNGNRLAFLGCNAPGPGYAQATEVNPGAVPCDTEELWSSLEALESEGHIPIFTFQWAEGSVAVPLQREAFRKAVDSGAAIVSGSQAHQPLGFEFYGDGFIHYGLGNLFFDQMEFFENRQEFIDRHVIYDGRHISTELLTALLEDYAQPRPMTPEERSDLLRSSFRSSGW